MNAHALLKNYLDENKIPYAKVAAAAGVKLSTMKSGIYNNHLSFEKYAKLAVVSGFDLEKNIAAIADTFKMDINECFNRLEVYEETMAPFACYQKIEDMVANAEEDTSFAVVCQMQKAVETAEAKKAEAKSETEEKEAEKMSVKDTVTNEPVHIGYNDVVRAVVCDMKGMQAVLVARALDALFHYKEDPDVNWIQDAQQDLAQLIEEHNL